MDNSNVVTIIVPVYGDWPSLKECIDSLKQHVDRRLAKIILINDCGPEVEIMEKKIKESIKNQSSFEYHRNSENLGFVGTCNRAVFELDKTNNDVLLLNSDTKVTGGFLEELQAVFRENPSIGVVSPRSNNATIATIPLSAAPQKGINSQESYEIFQKIKPLMSAHVIVPTAHGFCMLIRRSLIKKYGLFDSVFGKGYGEEVDFCLRIAKHGYKSALCNRAYVFHLEARSFSLATKEKLLETNNKIIWKRYPTYRQQVRGYMEKELIKENKIQEDSGIHLAGTRDKPLTKLAKRNPKVYKFAKKIQQKIYRT